MVNLWRSILIDIPLRGEAIQVALSLYLKITEEPQCLQWMITGKVSWERRC